MINVFEQGAIATKWRINDSHLVWDQLVELLTQDLRKSPTAEKVRRFGQCSLIDSKRLMLPGTRLSRLFNIRLEL
jgi:hypothetical protein